MNDLLPIILCGGSGTRLWPLSRSGFPKQFLSFAGDQTLFQQTAQRLMQLGANNKLNVMVPYVVCNEAHRFLASEQLREIGLKASTLLLEPSAKNTAPALTLAALEATSQGGDPILIVAPADHVISDYQAFAAAIERAVIKAQEGAIVILGIPPERPETGYGYIKVTEDNCPQEKDCLVERFVEKPYLAKAKQYLSDGGYYWNAGIFVLKASVWINALASLRPDIAQTVEAAWVQRTSDGQCIRPDRDAFERIPAESIDYAVIEHCADRYPLFMVPLDAGWNDLGAWDAVWSVHPKDNAGNAHQGDVLSIDCANTLVYATSRLVSLVGAQDLIVVETPDAVLVANSCKAQAVKDLVNDLDQQKRDELSLHRKVHRPWGWYDSIDQGERFKVKRIQVNPGASLSLQKHEHRAEHWIVVKGEADISRGEERLRLTENQSTYIPRGETHRLSNPGAVPLEIIEVQSGEYLGEDDIVRLEDNYGRSGA